MERQLVLIIAQLESLCDDIRELEPLHAILTAERARIQPDAQTARLIDELEERLRRLEDQQRDMENCIEELRGRILQLHLRDPRARGG